MQKTETLRNLLEEFAAGYNDGQRIRVEFSSGVSYAHPDGHIAVDVSARRTLNRQVDDVNELRTIINTVSHEVEHIRESNLKDKEKFANTYDEEGVIGRSDVAGAVFNILEDQYVDQSRCTRYPGLRRTQAFKTDAIMGNDNRRPPLPSIDTREQQLTEGMLQIAFAGSTKGRPDDGDIADFLVWFRSLAKQARYEDDRDKRYALAAKAMDRIDELIDWQTVDQDALDDLKDLIENANHEPSDETSGSGSTGNGHKSPEIDIDELPDVDEDVEVEQGDGGDGGDGDAEENDDDGGSGAGSGSSSGEEDTFDYDGGDTDSAGDWWGADEDDDYSEASQLDADRLDEYEERKKITKTDVEKRKTDRDNRMTQNEETLQGYKHVGHEKVRERLNETGQADAVIESFRELKHADEWVEAENGDRLAYRNTVRRMAGDTAERNLYQRKTPGVTGNRNVMVALDMSTSMCGDDEGKAKAAVGSLALACEEIGDQFGVVAYRTDSNDNVISELVTAPDEKFKFEHLDATKADGSTPTAVGVKDAANILQQSAEASTQDMVFVITDGAACHETDEWWDEYGGEPSTYLNHAIDEAVAEIQNARADGTAVFGIGIGMVEEDDMRDTFGDRGYVMGESDTLADDLVELYERQLGIDGRR